MTKAPILLAASLLLVLPLTAAPAAADSCGHQCSIQECDAALVAGPVGITCSVGEPVYCEHPWYTIDHCQVWQVCNITGTGVVGCASGDGAQGTCITVGAPGKCTAVHVFTVGPGDGPFYNTCSTLGTGGTSPLALPTATVAQDVAVLCSVAITYNT